MIHALVINSAFKHSCFATLVCPILYQAEYANSLMFSLLLSLEVNKKIRGGMRFFCSFIVSPRGESVSEQTQESKSSFRGDKARTLGEGVCGGEVLQGRGQRSVWERPGDGESVINRQTTPQVVVFQPRLHAGLLSKTQNSTTPPFGSFQWGIAVFESTSHPSYESKYCSFVCWEK